MSARILNIGISTDSGLTICHVSGPADSDNIERLREALERLTHIPNALILMDCTELTYLNSRAIGMLLKYYRQIAFNRGRLAIFGINTKIVRTLELLHIGKELPIYATREEALAVLR